MSDEIKQYEPTRGIEGSILCVLYIYIKKRSHTVSSTKVDRI